MTSPDDFKRLILLEREIGEAEERLISLLNTRALLARGNVLLGRLAPASGRNLLRFTCSNNISRFRVGDKVELSSKSSGFSAIIRDMTGNGRTLILDTRKKMNRQLGGEWLLGETETDLSSVILSSLNKLHRGGPGWHFFQTLIGEKEPRRVKSKMIPEDKIEEILSDLTEESGHELDASQKEIFSDCLQSPTSFAAQGPPGTGKTMLLAFAAEALARLGKRVVIFAPTHQAVNNALSTIRRNFPERKLLKVGDDLRRESLSEDISTSLLRKNETLTNDVFNGDTILGMTFLSGICHLILRNSPLAPNVAFIEEAGQLPLAQGVCAGLVGAGSILMFGDDMQMPPVFTIDISEEPLAKSLFASFREIHPEHVKMLTISYRLNDELCGIIGESFYADESGTKLRPSERTKNCRFHLESAKLKTRDPVSSALSPDNSFVWVKSQENISRSLNGKEAEFTAEILAECLRRGLEAKEVAAVTPFRRQAARIRSLLERKVPDLKEFPIIDTVERVQGLTVELVVVSVCASDTEYIASVSEFLLSPNRLNVSLSRARTKAILVASDSIFEILPGNYRTFLAQRKWRRLLDKTSYILI